MHHRQLGSLEVSALGLGCLTLTAAYGTPPAEADAIALIHRARAVGIDFLDTSDAYAKGENEIVVGKAIAGRRGDYVVASKFGNLRRPDGTPMADGRPAYVKQACEASLRRLKIDTIDLYYIHRIDPTVPIEDTVGAMAALVAGREGALPGNFRSSAGHNPPRACGASVERACRSNTRCGRGMSKPACWMSAASWTSASSDTARWDAASSPARSRRNHPPATCGMACRDFPATTCGITWRCWQVSAHRRGGTMHAGAVGAGLAVVARSAGGADCQQQPHGPAGGECRRRGAASFGCHIGGSGGIVRAGEFAGARYGALAESVVGLYSRSHTANCRRRTVIARSAATKQSRSELYELSRATRTEIASSLRSSQ